MRAAQTPFAFGLLLVMAAGVTPAVAQTVTISPASVIVPFGGDQRLTAYVNGVASTAVAWAVNGIAGGSSALGIIDATGKYTAPAAGLAGRTVTATATNRSNPTAFGTCVITLRNRTPGITSLGPNTLPLGPFALQVRGRNFVRGARVLWNDVPLTTTFTSSMSLMATGTAAHAGAVKITVANPGPGAVSTAATLIVTSSAVGTVTVTPAVTPTEVRTRTVTATAPRSPTPPSTVTSTTPREVRTPTIVPTVTASAVRTPTMPPTAMPSEVRTRSVAPTATASAVRTFTMVPTTTPTEVRTRTAAPTTTASAMRTSTMPPTATPSEIRTRTIVATPTAGASRTPTGALTAAPRVSVSVAPASATVQTGSAQQFQATVTASANQAVTWKVNNTAGGDSTVGTISATGLYTAPATAPALGSVIVSAVCAADGVSQGTAVVAIQDPLAVTYGRFLDQATFGPTQPLTAHLGQIGIPAFIDEQFAMAESPWPPLDTAQRSDAVDAFFGNALAGQDQLRQRVIFALSEIIVEAMNKNTNGDEIVPWLQLLSRNAFGNYRTLLEEITLDASMGKYLDLANSGLSGGAANENFPREVMQLFSIGLYQLNLDGSVQVDAHNAPIPTYTQTDVQQLARALTGWTYGNPTGTPPAYGNFNYYPGPMLPVAAYHDTSAKTILGHTLPAKQSIQQDLEGAIDIIFQHPNVGPFLATRLIRALVTSNPSPAYIARVAAAFNGTGVRGDMQAVIRAILLDPEARDDTPPANFGRLRTPMQHTIALARALGLDLGAASQFAYLFYNMNEGLLDAASVFGHYSPTYHIPTTTLFGPEFQIYSASDAINRANLFYWFMYNPWPINPALQPFVAVAGNAARLVDAVDHALLFGRMSQATRTALLNALPAMPDDNARVLTVLYLTSMSGEYLIQR